MKRLNLDGGSLARRSLAVLGGFGCLALGLGGADARSLEPAQSSARVREAFSFDVRAPGSPSVFDVAAADENCPLQGDVQYTLATVENPTPTEQMAYERITQAMDRAVSIYNCFTNISKRIRVSFVPSVPTADGNFNGSIRFGADPGFMDFRTAMHEISHTVGVGQAPNWNEFVQNGQFIGEFALRQLQEINASLERPLDTKVNADRQHFWPYGINRQSEVQSEADLVAHCLMVMAIRMDLGLSGETL